MGQSKVLATMLQEMQGAGLTWNHPFVQCRIQGALFALREKSPMPPNLCGHLAPDPEILDPQSPLAYVRFRPPLTPLTGGDYPNDEEFYAPVKKSMEREKWVLIVLCPNGLLSFPLLFLITFSLHSFRILYLPKPPRLTTADYDELAFLDQLTKPELADEEERNERLAEVVERYRLEQLMRAAEEKAREEQDPILPIITSGSFFTERQRQLEADALNQVLEEIAEEERQNGEEEIERHEIKRMMHSKEMPHTSFREVARVEHIPAVSYYREPHQIFEDSDWMRNADTLSLSSADTNVGEHEQKQLIREDADEIVPVDSVVPAEGGGGIYTEGGMVYLPGGPDERSGGEEQETAESNREEARSILANMLGFTRHERFDVKKPGPLVVPPPPPAQSQNKEVLPVADVDTPKTKKLVIEGGGHPTEDHGVHSVDTEYAHVKFTTPVDNWRDGERIVQAIGEQLNMVAFFSHIRVDQHEVSFRVDTNPEKKTAMDVAKAINDPRFKSNLSRRLGVNVLYAGIGDKTQATDWNEQMTRRAVKISEQGGVDSTHLMVYIFVGAGAAAILVAVITLFVIKRHDKVKSKLIGLGGSGNGSGGVDSSKDYQELCRARMAGKGSGGTEPTSATSGRITSLTKENERPPSSRSSTSSWSEEPMTNMDISTGHMVLSYMEDHLRNKGRLQREWEALCRYEAEPNSREAGLQEQSEKLNRDGAPLPFDHSRVVLNHLANAEGLDYINASTIVSILSMYKYVFKLLKINKLYSADGSRPASPCLCGRSGSDAVNCGPLLADDLGTRHCGDRGPVSSAGEWRNIVHTVLA